MEDHDTGGGEDRRLIIKIRKVGLLGLESAEFLTHVVLNPFSAVIIEVVFLIESVMRFLGFCLYKTASFQSTQSR